MEKVHGVFVMILLEMLKFLMLMVVHHLMLIIEKIKLVLCKVPSDGINDSTGAAEKELVLILIKQIQNFAQVYITMLARVTCI